MTRNAWFPVFVLVVMVFAVADIVFAARKEDTAATYLVELEAENRFLRQVLASREPAHVCITPARP